VAAEDCRIGHSFGALVLEKALAQALVGTLLYGEPFVPGVEKSRTDRVFKPADLFLLVNSAAESIYSKELIDMYRDTTPLQGAPHVIMISSDADMATDLAVPIGTKLSNTPKVLREVSVRIMRRDATPHSLTISLKLQVITIR
jgi:hypothetical protein